MRTALGYDDVFLEHRTGEHPERPARLTAIMESLGRRGLVDRCMAVEAQPAPDEWIGKIHSSQYIRRLVSACQDDMPFIDCADSVICPDSYRVACRAVSMTLAACDIIVAGTVENAFCALRPPGHHAEHDRSAGFCLFNNIAIAARYLQQRHGLKRILIIDWDVHHGNGTQHSFEPDGTVFYCSLHQHPATCYPGTGWPDERGTGPGLGYTLNLPVQPGIDDQEYLEFFTSCFLAAVVDFRPDFILISAGFDGHRKDPLAQLNLSEHAYNEMTRQMKVLARQSCRGRLLSLLEGGYQLGALGNCVAEHVEILLQDD